MHYPVAFPARCLVGVGVGPGDPDLVTVKALRTLQRSDVILVPQQVEPVVLSAYPGAVGALQRVGDRHHASWRVLADAAVAAFEEGADVVSLATLGDPTSCSAFAHMAERLQQTLPDVAVDVVPGVASDVSTVLSARLHAVSKHPYLAGLRLAGREVLVVGAGCVATRRLPALLEAGARVRLIAPEASAAVRAFAGAGQVEWVQGRYDAGLLGDPWYVMALTDDPEINAAIAAECERRRLFCVRGDDAEGGSAWTPASGTVDGLVVGVVGNRTPRRSARARDTAVRAIADML